MYVGVSIHNEHRIQFIIIIGYISCLIVSNDIDQYRIIEIKTNGEKIKYSVITSAVRRIYRIDYVFFRLSSCCCFVHVVVFLSIFYFYLFPAHTHAH